MSFIYEFLSISDIQMILSRQEYSPSRQIIYDILTGLFSASDILNPRHIHFYIVFKHAQD